MVKLFFFTSYILFHTLAQAAPLYCDCTVKAYSPLTANQKFAPKILKIYQLETYAKYSFKNQLACREECKKSFDKDFPQDELHTQLKEWTQELIEQGVLGHNCTGTTTLKFPIRVKAQIGKLRLGNVADFVTVIGFDHSCF